MLISLWIALCGALGAATRYTADVGAKLAVERNSQWAQVPGATTVGIFVVNVVGSLVAGVAFGISLEYPGLWSVYMGGFLSGFTTFSTAMVDVLKLGVDGYRGRAFALWLGQFVTALLAAFAGVGLATLLA